MGKAVVNIDGSVTVTLFSTARLNSEDAQAMCQTKISTEGLKEGDTFTVISQSGRINFIVDEHLNAIQHTYKTSTRGKRDSSHVVATNSNSAIN